MLLFTMIKNLDVLLPKRTRPRSMAQTLRLRDQQRVSSEMGLTLRAYYSESRSAELWHLNDGVDSPLELFTARPGPKAQKPEVLQPACRRDRTVRSTNTVSTARARQTTSLFMNTINRLRYRAELLKEYYGETGAPSESLPAADTQRVDVVRVGSVAAERSSPEPTRPSQVGYPHV